jgi:hypothetical protein
MEAKLVAIKWNRTSWLELNPADNSVVIRSTDNSGNPISTSTTVFLPAEAVIDSGSTVSVTFTSLGRNQSVGGTTIPLNFPRTSQCRDINVSASGKVTVVACTLDP